MTRRRTYAHEVRVGILLLVAVLVFGWLSVQVGSFRGLGDSVRVTAVFDDASGLVPDSAVKVAGVEVGGLEKLEVDFDKAVATLVLRQSANIRSDVRAEIRARSLLGEKFIALVPRSETAPLLKDGDQIDNTFSGIEIDSIISAFGPLVKTIDPDDIARLVKNLSGATATLGDDAPELLDGLKTLIERLNVAAEIAPEMKEQLPALVKELRGTVRRLNSTVQRADASLSGIDTLVAQVQTATAGLPDTVNRVDAMVRAIEPGMDDLNAALEESDEAMAAMRRVLDKVDAIDDAAIRRILREEGVLVRLRPADSGDGKKGRKGRP